MSGVEIGVIAVAVLGAGYYVFRLLAKQFGSKDGESGCGKSCGCESSARKKAKS